jgi:hypothetical protein
MIDMRVKESCLVKLQAVERYAGGCRGEGEGEDWEVES